jgi:DNA-binding response OmpR family regulator
MRILIVEDDAALGSFLLRGLRLEGHEAILMTDGSSGQTAATEGQFDLIVLDLSLPQRDGIEVLQGIRSEAVDASILVLTGRNNVEDRVKCLDLGADDFLMKPFSYSELAARCRALLRRRERYADPTLRHGGVELHRIERKVCRGGRAIDLTVKEFALLEYLMLARGRTCTRSELLREVWQMSPDAGTNVVDVYVNYLRKKLGTGVLASDLDGSRIIETVRGEGYAMGLGASKKPVRSVVGPTHPGLIAGVVGPVPYGSMLAGRGL